MFLKGSNWNGWMDRQREVVPKRQGTGVKISRTSIGLDPRDWQTVVIVWSQWMGRKQCNKHGMKINRLFFTQGFVGQQINLKQYSKAYWQPMKGTKQWKAAGKWRRPCHQAGQLLLYKLEALWGQCQQYHTKVNCNNRDDWTQEQLQVILHYPDQGYGDYVADPAYGKSMSYRLLIYVSERWNFYQTLLQDSEQI